MYEQLQPRLLMRMIPFGCWQREMTMSGVSCELADTRHYCSGQWPLRRLFPSRMVGTSPPCQHQQLVLLN
jgi:hypothetical protein